MEVLFHFVFQLIKIALLSCLYAGLLYFAFKHISKSNKDSWFQRSTSEKVKFWIISGSMIYISLFFWMFSYWGSHGLGDSARIPIGNGYAIENINWTEHGFVRGVRTIDNKKISMTRFKLIDGNLVGNLESWFDGFENNYFIFSLESGQLSEFVTKPELDNYLISRNLPKSKELYSFRENYNNYWLGWRFWMLP